MSKKEKKSAVTRKRRAPNEPGSPDFVKTDVKKESWENWKPKSEKIYSKGLPSNNAPENPEPMGGAVAFEKSREKVLAALKEVIQHLIMQEVTEPTIKAAAGTQIPEYNPQGLTFSAKLPVNELSSDKKPLENPELIRTVANFARNFMWLSYRINNTGKKEDKQSLENIKKIFREAPVNYFKAEAATPDSEIIGYWVVSNPYADSVATQLINLTNDQISNLEEIINKSEDISDVTNIRNFLETKVYPRRDRPKEKTIETKKSIGRDPALNVTKEINYIGSEDIKESLAEFVEFLEKSGKDKGEISKLIAAITRDILDPNFKQGKSTTETALAISNAKFNSKYSGKEMPYLGAPNIPPEQQGILSNVTKKVKGLLGLNEEQAKQLMERYDIRTEADYAIFIEAIALVLKEGK